jgi:ribosomal protein L31
MGKQKRESCRELFKELKILPLKSQYILSLALFILKNKTNLVINSDQHSFYTGNCKNFFVPQANLTTFQKGVYYSGVKIFTKLPNDIKKWSDNSKKFKKVLRQFLNMHSFYTVEEFLNR